MTHSPDLADDLTVNELQRYIRDKIAERGFDKETTQQKFMLLTEEVGELAKSLRSYSGIKTADDSAKLEIKEEAADVLWSLTAVCNTLGIDLLDAVRTKEAKNAGRTWH